MGIGDDELHTAHTSTREPTQELRPERLGFGSADSHAQNLAPAIGLDADGDDGNGNNATTAPDLQIDGIDPETGSIALHGSFEEGLHLDIDLFAQAAHLALGDAAHTHALTRSSTERVEMPWI